VLTSISDLTGVDDFLGAAGGAGFSKIFGGDDSLTFSIKFSSDILLFLLFFTMSL